LHKAQARTVQAARGVVFVICPFHMLVSRGFKAPILARSENCNKKRGRLQLCTDLFDLLISKLSAFTTTVVKVDSFDFCQLQDP
jgi:hypothetical protein